MNLNTLFNEISGRATNDEGLGRRCVKTEKKCAKDEAYHVDRKV